MNTKLSSQQIEQYQRDGIVFPIKVFADDEAAVFRGTLESIAADCGQASLKRFDSLHLFFDWAYRLVTHDALLDAVEGLLGNNILVDGTLVFYKPPHDSSYVSWHQDSVYSGWNLSPSTSAWIALTPSHARNGCMRVIPGSHQQGLLDHANIPEGPNLLKRGERVETGVDESSAIDVVLQPGEMSFHHSTIIHGSNPNSSDQPRVGFIVRFVTNQFTNQGRALLRVRGEGDCSHLNLARPPAEHDSRKCLSGVARVCELFMTYSQTLNRLKSLQPQPPLAGSGRIEVSAAQAEKLLTAAERLPLYDNQEFYSDRLQADVRDSVRAHCPDDFDGLIKAIKKTVVVWPYWVRIGGLKFDDGNRLFVAINRAFGELVAPPFEKPRAQLVHYIQPATDLRSARGGRESERLHTDTADWKVPVELISMTCVRPDPGGGGRSRILDVDTVRGEVRNRLGEAALNRLETEPVPWQLAPYCGGGVDWRPVLTKTSICWRRYTIDLALEVEGAKLSAEMRALLQAFEEIITTAQGAAEFLMRESELLFSDNTRTIHARTPISDDNGSDRLMLRSWVRAA